MVQSSTDPSSLLALAESELQAGRSGNAENICRKIVLSHPSHIPAHLFLGTLEAKNGKAEDGANTLRNLIDMEPRCIEAHNWLAAILRDQGRYDEAIDSCKKAADLNPADPETLNNLGLTQFSAGRYTDAAESFKAAASCGTDNPMYLGNMGSALEAAGSLEGAEKAYLRALSKDGSNTQLCERLGLLLMRVKKHQEAAVWFQRIIDVNPDNVQALLCLGQALSDAHKFNEAQPVLERALILDPHNVTGYGILGTIAQRFGRFDEANKHLDKAIELSPDTAAPYFQRLNANKITEQQRPLVDRAIHLAAQHGSPYELRLLEYGIAKALNDLGEYEKAMNHYDEANRLSKLVFKDRKLSRNHESSQADLIIGTFSKNFIKCNSHLGNESDLPILVCGMPRSGTTLAAQILSSHFSVGAAGEQQFWTRHLRDVWVTGTRLDPAAVRDLTIEYLEHLQNLQPGKKHVIDKMPQNYMVAGLVNIALPNARIIHIRRHPVDTCLSIYFAPFHDPMDFCHVRENIVAAYRTYLRLVAHWRAVLPADRFLEIDYEDLVSNHRGSAKRMLGFCSLDWDEACMFPERNTRIVTTASLWQARQPVNKNSLERWRRYEPWLGAFRDLLNKEHDLRAA